MSSVKHNTVTSERTAEWVDMGECGHWGDRVLVRVRYIDISSNPTRLTRSWTKTKPRTKLTKPFFAKMSIALVHSAIHMDLDGIRRNASPHVAEFIRACEEIQVEGKALAYSVKNFVLSGDVALELQAINMTDVCGLPLEVICGKPNLAKIYARVCALHDKNTAVKAVERAMRMPVATMKQYNSDKMMDDLVRQLANRDDRKNAKSKRRATG